MHRSCSLRSAAIAAALPLLSGMVWAGQPSTASPEGDARFQATLPEPEPPSAGLRPDQGKLLLTAAFTDVDGAGGGGLTPWALITGYGSSSSWGANAHLTQLRLDDFDFRAWGVAVGVLDRIELSYARQDLQVRGTALDGIGVSQDILGAKVRLVGNTVYAQDQWLPQLAVGVQVKRNRGVEDGSSIGMAGLTEVTQLGARDEDGTDYYLSATKIFLAQSFALNVTARHTSANQFGLLGFGGDLDSGRSLQLEGSAALLLSRRVAVGLEYRSRPRNLSADDEGDAWDAFIGWTPTKNISLVAAYVDLGSVLTPVHGETRAQNGAYLSLQAGF